MPTSLLCTKWRWPMQRRRRAANLAATPPDVAGSTCCTCASGATPAAAAGGHIRYRWQQRQQELSPQALAGAGHPARSAMPIERNRS
jgi:hypothetical protein